MNKHTQFFDKSHLPPRRSENFEKLCVPGDGRIAQKYYLKVRSFWLLFAVGGVPMAVRSLLCQIFFLLFWSGYANAHVKWFAEYNLLCPPRSPYQIISGEYFLFFCLFVGPVMFTVAYVDRYLVYRRTWPSRLADALTDYSQPYFPMALRLGVSAFFLAAAAYGGFMLTPELKTHDNWVFAMHLAIAGLAFLQRTAFVAGLGIVILYAYAIAEFGFYHLLDYPIFLGVAAYLMIDSLFGRERFVAAHNTLRLCTGITLLWAGIEKFAFPEWSFGLLDERPDLAFGFSAEFYMVAAGFVEFCCAYLLITGMLSARVAALVLLFFFVSAIYYFGLIDAIGHSAIIIVLALLILSRNPIAFRFHTSGLAKTAALHTGFLFGALALFIGLYYGGHQLSYRSLEISSQCEH